MNAPLAKVSLDDKFTLDRGPVLISGTQAMVRAALMQQARDRAAGLNTAGYISGYRGSPLGGLDLQLARAQALLSGSNIHFEPGLNEDLAATAVWGTQQANALPGARYDGVFGMWYGKGPGVDRSGDALKHANNAGTSPNGGVLAVFGDDHPGKSSTLAHQSEQGMVGFSIPILYPATLQEYLDYALLGWAMSRFASLWVGFKCVNETVENTATVMVDPDRAPVVLPDYDDPAPYHIQMRYAPMEDDMILLRRRLPRAQAFAAANGLDRIALGDASARFGIVTSGKAYLDVMQSMTALGIDDTRAKQLGIAIYKIGMTWPIEEEGLRQFARGKQELVFVEEKRAFLEPQAAAILYHLPESERPQISGKTAPDGELLFASDMQLEMNQVAHVIATRMSKCGMADDSLRARAASLTQAAQDAAGTTGSSLVRTPFFCSGCPHNRSTKLPDGSIASSGIGCHGIATILNPKSTVPGTHMGAEGTNWIGMSRFTETKHMFQNLGDGTYSHSGILAIRAAVNANVNITYKILYNDAVAMTGGQPVEGGLTVDQIARQVAAEGVQHIAIVSDEPEKYHRGIRFPDNAGIHHRSELDKVQREMRDTAGVTAIIYDQTCAAEKRRRRKRGTFANPARRPFINERVCEGCGDCSVKANCVSIQPLDTPLGRKRKIDQSSCNKDMSCIEGFCPSFVTVHGAEPRRAQPKQVTSDFATGVPEPQAAQLDETFNLLINGVGGTGVVTIGAVLGMAAHMESRSVSIYDMTGLSQKGGTVFSHLRLAPGGTEIAGPKIGPASADVLLGCDLVVSGGKESLAACVPGVTNAVVNVHLTPTGAFQLNPDLPLEANPLEGLLRQRVGADRLHSVDASTIARTLLGDTIGANMFMVGYALQLGLLPVSLAAVESAIELNGVAVKLNMDALALGRLAAHDAAACAKLLAADGGDDDDAEEPTLDALIAERIDWLADYQNDAYADRYRGVLDKVRAAEQKLPGDSVALSHAVTRYLYKVMAYKDEYEVARLYTDGTFERALAEQFEDGYELSFHLAPPWFAARDPSSGLPAKREYGAWVMKAFRVLAGMRRWRGTALDLFGMTDERRRERQIREDYIALVSRLADNLTSANLDIAVELAELPERIRGFGHVKSEHIDRVDQVRAELMEKFEAADAPQQSAERAAVPA
ncbi:MAG: indolepyruvate ferredoxin oxidoreductase [Gammaproteobacteria bacterium]|nr:indolepyruvate ferredoxin oxidoreductase [Gammaproteobacteria bacterium]